MLRLLSFVILAVAAGSGTGIAQEASTPLGAGGLVLARTAQVTIEKQVVTIGLDEITARYTFRNGGEKDESFLLTFPMPEIDGGDLIETPARFPEDDPVNFLDLRITVDGEPVTPEFEQRAHALGLDLTGLLREEKLPINPSAADARSMLSRMAGRRKEEFSRRGLAVFESADAVYPLWTATTIAFWNQLFPVGKDVTITVTYKPVAGEIPVPRNAQREDLSLEEYCVDDALWSTLSTRPGASGFRPAYEVRYDLTAGTDWMGPVKAFELAIEKPGPTAAVAVCLEEGTSTKTGIRFEAADFVPERDLKILFVPGEG